MSIAPKVVVTPQLTCIFCLQDDNKIISYQGFCNCHPFIHEKCMNDWNKINFNKCPICLNMKEQDIIIHTSRIKLISILLCLFCCISIIIAPFILLAILYSVPYTNKINYNTTNS